MSLRLVLVAAGRGDLPFALLHDEPLLAHALRASRAGLPDEGEVVVVVDEACRDAATAVASAARATATVTTVEEWWTGRGDRVDVLHDPLCPLVPADFLRDVAERAVTGMALAAYRPVTDTVKTARGDRIRGTIDRDRLGVVVAPVSLPPGVGAGEPAPPLGFARLVEWLRERVPVELVRAPSLARRVVDAEGVVLLECVKETARRVR
jgi:2-C-methyl-D-erythritol 4-phosphate cytidylyltransferase